MRDQHITERIMAACEKYKTGQVVFVDVRQNSIEHALRDSGYPNVSSVYMINHTTDIPRNIPEWYRNFMETRTEVERDHDEMESSRNEILRTKAKNMLYIKKMYMKENRYEQVNIINIYDNPNINATEKVLSILSGRQSLA